MSDNRPTTGIAARARAAHDLIKPELPVAAGACVVVGEVIASGSMPGSSILILGFLVGFFISATAMISNDYFDLEVDRINHPTRPLPSGRISAKEVMILALLFSVAGLIAAGLLGTLPMLLALAMWAVSNLYNWRYKETGLLGNMMVAFCLSQLFILGGVAVGRLDNPLLWTFAALIFVFDLGEEIAGGAMDMEGDRKRSSRSIALLYGRRNALLLSGLLFSLFVLISLIPFLMGWLGSALLFIIVPMDLVILYFASRLMASRGPEEGRMRIRQLYLSTMVFIIGLTAACIVQLMITARSVP
ncbi:MAG: UbiA family prenyltransferase [Methanothrix sp.]|jgi:geranylgeranylglycerol-phosphate geranylgeranyltransferase|uniref:UbiA family prenyltransferase n=1 Tax=Methanothrix sp. TaxID=90426 RepID=UPI0032AE89AA